MMRYYFDQSWCRIISTRCYFIFNALLIEIVTRYLWPHWLAIDVICATGHIIITTFLLVQQLVQKKNPKLISKFFIAGPLGRELIGSPMYLLHKKPIMWKALCITAFIQQLLIEVTWDHFSRQERRFVWFSRLKATFSSQVIHQNRIVTTFLSQRTDLSQHSL